MRILLLYDSRPPLPPTRVTTFLTQVVRRARDAGHDLRELVPHDTDAGKGLDDFRARMRGRLDTEIRGFDPQIIHIHGLGVLGHLALESGAPYVISVFADELARAQGESTWRSHIQEAMENAGCVIVDSEETRRVIETMFGDVQAVAIAVETGPASDADSFGWLWETYRVVSARRFQA